MHEIRISDKISYLPCAESPLSADIGLIREGGTLWLYDVGCGEDRLPENPVGASVVLSHFHRDHTGNLEHVKLQALYVSKQTYAHVHAGTVVTADLTLGGLRIFPLPSAHAAGCLGLEADETYAFVGDALYGKPVPDGALYNAQLLQAQIQVLKALRAPYLLMSHLPGLIRRKDEAIAELEAIYRRRDKDSPYIFRKRD